MMINSIREYSQSAINWRAIKNIYAQGSKRVFSPKPNRIPLEKSSTKYSFDQIEKYVATIITQITDAYNKRLQILQNETKKMLLSMQKKVQTLQQQIKLLKEQKEQQWSNNYSQVKDLILIKQFQHCVEHTLIDIEESEEEQSLLDSIHKQKIYQNADKFVFKTKKKNYQMMKSSSNCRKLFQETQMKTQPSEVIYPFSTRQSSIFDCYAKDMKQQLNMLKHFIQVTNNVKIQNYPFPVAPFNQVELKTQITTIQINGSKNQVFHLKNQNIQLRNSINDLKQQLKNCSKQLKAIKAVLVKGISHEEDQ